MVLYSARGLTSRSQARELLALAAKEVWGLSPLPEIVRGEWGKPCFSGLEGRHFNLSHSGDLGLCALDSFPVGADIQIVKAWRPALPRRVCARVELEWLEEQSDFGTAFALLWTLKEARAKENGRGLTAPIQDIRVPLPAAGAVRFEGMWFRTWTGPGWAAAVCGQSEPPEKFLEKVLDIPTV